MKRFKVAVIAGDGIGKEVVPEGVRVVEAAGKRFGFQFEWHPFDWSCERYAQTGPDQAGTMSQSSAAPAGQLRG